MEKCYFQKLHILNKCGIEHFHVPACKRITVICSMAEVNTLQCFMYSFMAERGFSLNNSLNTKTYWVLVVYTLWCDAIDCSLRYFQ